jgi:hypothetical protein
VVRSSNAESANRGLGIKERRGLGNISHRQFQFSCRLLVPHTQQRTTVQSSRQNHGDSSDDKQRTCRRAAWDWECETVSIVSVKLWTGEPNANHTYIIPYRRNANQRHQQLNHTLNQNRTAVVWNLLFYHSVGGTTSSGSTAPTSFCITELCVLA